VGTRTVLVWRHGQTAWNAQRRFQGQLDVSLDDVGREQAARAAALLAGFAPSAIVSSDLVRARETAQALADVTGLPIATDPRLREIDVGVWQGLTFDEVSERFPAEAASWRDGGDGRRGGGESLVEVGARAVAAVDDALLGLADDGTLVVVTHGAAGRAIVASMIGLPTPLWRSLGSLANCCWSLMGEAASGWRLFDHNAGSLPEVVVGDDR
jgi:glucosyl-3-phosphoglycerate phosphatase